ncbi:MAG: tryptophan synthase subunit alpha [Deltaproteobacteria bacterium]|nr:tryptophan synthase subunit alpha [Deltaproteobacteria bacterium]
MSRYQQMFESLKRKNEGAFVPFWMLGDPDPETSLARIKALVENGADALELGIPFSDPVADGPVVQRAAMRALCHPGLEPGSSHVSMCFRLVQQIRANYPEIPIGILTYANLAVRRSLESFYADAAQAGVDSVLLADVPTLEAPVFCEAAMQAGVDPVMIAPPNSTPEQLQDIAKLSKGYVYSVTRAGVTGADDKLNLSSKALITKLAELGAPPVMLGFGISKPEHVRQALAEGAAGAISGSAVVKIGIEKPDELAAFVKSMKEATNDNKPSASLFHSPNQMA